MPSPPGVLPNLGIEPMFPALQLNSLLSEPAGKPRLAGHRPLMFPSFSECSVRDFPFSDPSLWTRWGESCCDSFFSLIFPGPIRAPSTALFTSSPAPQTPFLSRSASGFLLLPPLMWLQAKCRGRQGLGWRRGRRTQVTMAAIHRQSWGGWDGGQVQRHDLRIHSWFLFK